MNLPKAPRACQHAFRMQALSIWSSVPAFQWQPPVGRVVGCSSLLQLWSLRYACNPADYTNVVYSDQLYSLLHTVHIHAWCGAGSQYSIKCIWVLVAFLSVTNILVTDEDVHGQIIIQLWKLTSTCIHMYIATYIALWHVFQQLVVAQFISLFIAA